MAIYYIYITATECVVNALPLRRPEEAATVDLFNAFNKAIFLKLHLVKSGINIGKVHQKNPT